ncbi:MAG: cupredoxin domain-containing protein [Actinomycetota bacterium]
MTRTWKLAGAAAAAAALAVPAAVAAAGGDGTGSDGPTRDAVTVTLTARHSRFSPSTTEVPPGATVTFVVRNLDPIDHELIVGGPEVHRRHEAGTERHHHGDVPGEISVPAGATVSTTWTAPASGRVAYSCHLPGHLAYGMTGTLLVTTRS